MNYKEDLEAAGGPSLSEVRAMSEDDDLDADQVKKLIKKWKKQEIE